MTNSPVKKLFVALICTAGIFVVSCKGKEKNTTTTDTVITAPKMDNATAPVEINPDAALTTMSNDAVKDYPGISATVNNGEITITGNITREKLPKLMMALNAIHPKKINNQLTIK